MSITFKGIVCFYVPKDAHDNYIDPKAVLVSEPAHHTGSIRLPAMNSTELNDAIGETDCSGITPCTLKVVGIRIGDPSLSQAFSIGSTSFDAVVSHLQQANPSFTDFIDDASDLQKPPKSGGKVLAYVDLRGAKVTNVDPFKCGAKFDSDPPMAPFRDFARAVTVEFSTTTPMIQFIGGNADGKWHIVHFASSSGTDIVISDVGPHGPNMQYFSLLSKSGVKMPKVLKDPNCTKPFGDVPGCGNSQWP